jgi:TolA-binding protein
MKKLSLIFLMMFLIISCSKKSDQDYLDQASNLEKENKISEAITTLETLLKELPQSKLAPKALIQLAIIYQNHKVKDLPILKSYYRAQQYFREVYDSYPNSEEAPSSLFMSSFILANNLQRYDDATAGYKLFMEKYPNSPLITAAKDELDNMGLSPEEILKKKEVVKH